MADPPGADDLAAEVQALSSRLLEAEAGRLQLEEQLRYVNREVEPLRADAADAEALRIRVAELEAEMADFSSNLLEEANKQVGDANRRIAAVKKLVDERDILLETQQTQIDFLKAMVEAAPPQQEPEPSLTENGVACDMATLVEDGAYASPVRPIPRYDTREFTEFCEIAGQTNWRRTRFGSRAVAEEVVPTLALESAVHVSWLSCRSWLQAVLDGTLVLEPVPPSERVWATRPSHPCVLCGESRPNPHYARLYQARVPRDAQPFALGLECHARVRFACEYTAFLRSIADGVRHMDTPEQRQHAWQDCLLIREQLFWVRSGGLYPPKDAPIGSYLAPNSESTNQLSLDPETDGKRDRDFELSAESGVKTQYEVVSETRSESSSDHSKGGESEQGLEIAAKPVSLQPSRSPPQPAYRELERAPPDEQPFEATDFSDAVESQSNSRAATPPNPEVADESQGSQSLQTPHRNDYADSDRPAEDEVSTPRIA